MDMFSIADSLESSASSPSATGSEGTGKNGITAVRKIAIKPNSLNHVGNESDICPARLDRFNIFSLLDNVLKWDLPILF